MRKLAPLSRRAKFSPLARFAIIACLALTACVSPITAVQTSCPPLSNTFTPAVQMQIATEYAALPANSSLKDVVKDWLSMRTAIRACQGVKP